MEGGESIIVNAVPAADIIISPVGSPEHAPGADPVVPSPASDDDQSSGAAVVLTDELRDKIIQQVEYYFSDENLPNDKYMLGFIHKNKEGYVPIGVIASFKKIKRLNRDKVVIATALKESSLLAVSSDCKKVKRRQPLPSSEPKKASLSTVFVENLPGDHSIPNLRKIFCKAGKIKNISIHDPQSIVEPPNKAEKFISGKLYALVEYDCVDAAEKAVATLNNENDWRNGLRVKLLKQVVKHGQKKKAWRDADVEKNNDIQRPDQSGHEENHNLNEHHDRTLDVKNGEHPPKEKTAHRGRGQGQTQGHGHGQGHGRSRGHKSYGTNGHGHGSPSSSYTFEATKPPPGPKMPDGTRGFTMGRGRPLIPNHS